MKYCKDDGIKENIIESANSANGEKKRLTNFIRILERRDCSDHQVIDARIVVKCKYFMVVWAGLTWHLMDVVLCLYATT